ncbi:MAG TPA: glycosyltransferase family 39 protein [Planctomycetota bacterium]|nr:glycosyltransferase family 39 protein [Planctomycetota bacterium]HRR78824.1 glycosyltransferase family 39 protein [Planctomycetota bacterium]
MPGIHHPGRRLILALVVLAGIYGLVGRWWVLVDIPRHQDGVYGMIARNYLKYGYPDMGLAQIATPGPVVPRPERVYYQNHPPLAPLLSSAGVALFGPQTWAVRLPHLVCGLALVAVLAVLAERMSRESDGPPTPAWAWAAALAGAVPIAVRYGGAFVDVVGTPLALSTSLASLFYLRYCESGRGRDFGLLFAACVVGLLSDWPAYVLCFALAGHALVYRSRARRGAMLALPAAALACFVGLMAYARAIPQEGNLLQPVGEAYRSWAVGGSAPEVGHIPATTLLADFLGKFVLQLSPLSLLALVWLARRAWPAVRARENRRDQHVLLLWLWPLPYVAAFPTIFYAHPYYHLLFLPAVVVTVALVVEAWARGGGRWRGAASIGGAAVLFLSSFYVVTETDRWEPLRHKQVRWAADLAKHTPFEEKSGFVLHYAQQMRFVADRAVVEYADTPAKLAALGPTTRVFAPLAHPCGDADLFGALQGRGPATLCGSLVAFGPDPEGGGSWADGILRRLAKQELGAGVTLEKLACKVVPARDGSSLLLLGAELSGTPRVLPGDTLEWQVRFLDDGGKVLGTASMPAQASASYFLVAPKRWRARGGRAELALRHCTTDAASVGRGTRLARFALRLLTCRLLGNPKPAVRPLGRVELEVP